MPKQRKPKYNWEPGGFYPVYHFSDSDFQNLAAAVGIANLNQENKAEIEEATKEYFLEKHDRHNPMPRVSEVRAAILEIQKNTKKLIECLESTDRRTVQELSRTGKIQNIKLLYRFKEGNSELHQIQSATKKALEDIGVDKGTRPIEKSPLRKYIKKLKKIYENITGKLDSIGTYYDNYSDEYRGKFFKFVKAVFVVFSNSSDEKIRRLAKEEMGSNSALAQQIKISLKKT